MWSVRWNGYLCHDAGGGDENEVFLSMMCCFVNEGPTFFERPFLRREVDLFCSASYLGQSLFIE